MKKTLVCLLALLCLGCTSGSAIDADLIGPTIRDVAEVHDKYVQEDPDLTEAERSIYLTNTQLLRKALEEAESQ